MRLGIRKPNGRAEMDGDLDARVEKRGGRQGEGGCIITTTSEVLGERASCGRVRFFQLPPHLSPSSRLVSPPTTATYPAPRRRQRRRYGPPPPPSAHFFPLDFDVLCCPLRSIGAPGQPTFSFCVMRIGLFFWEEILRVPRGARVPRISSGWIRGCLFSPLADAFGGLE